MIKLTWKQLNQKPFISALMALNSNSKLDNVTAYRVGRLVEVLRRELTKAHEIEVKRAQELGERDEKGELIFVDVPGGKRAKLSDANSDILHDEMEKIFESNSVEIKINKLDFNVINGLTGEQLIAIEHICDNLPE